MYLLAFIHLEKCAGTTMTNLCRRNFMTRHCDVFPRRKDSMYFGVDDLSRLLRLNPAISSLAGHTIRPGLSFGQTQHNIDFYTILRDPVKRYISDYRHFVDILGYPPDIDSWLNWKRRTNFQTRALADSPDVEKAKETLDSLALVGLVEYFDEFLEDFQAMLHPWPFDINYKVANSAAKRSSATALFDFGPYMDRIQENNRLDAELYRYALDVLLPAQRARLAEARNAVAQTKFPRTYSPAMAKIRVMINRIYRNVVFKPYFGWSALKTHELPLYVRYVQTKHNSHPFDGMPIFGNDKD